ncbi:conjugal transfer protein [Streptomyces sp. NBC_00237]|uniref:conjugal transfer protein n=1 Tax=Streptomyces sp. NBC_00237 TaxID=2975687 RepID=UPI002250D36F|nr:conjugal transfer protein [Streptomyces sp. NBC_00237]MCX5207696.1 conjugal transfer protein [Streptomyces sp. NBC_00237]
MRIQRSGRETVETKPVNPYEAAAREQLGHVPKAAPAAAAQGWTPIPERSGGFARVGRWVLWGTVGLLAFAGLKGVLFPREAGPGPVRPAPGAAAAETFPAAAAQATAARAAYAYLTWDQAAPEARAQALAPLLAAGTDPAAGWNRQGVQAVETVLPGPVVTVGGGRARVRVEARVRTPDKAPPRWVALEVPVAAVGGRVVVTGAPALVGLPTGPPSAPVAAPHETDPAFSRATTAAVAAFFRSLARGDAAAVTAPGAVVPPLPSGVRLVGMQSWTADAGTGRESGRWGTAAVTWGIGGGEVAQIYRVQLTRVSAESASRWQVARLTGP